MRASFLLHYRVQDAVARFSIAAAITGLQGDLAQGLNPCVECCDRHTGAGRIALRWVSVEGRLEEYTFEQLQALSIHDAEVSRLVRLAQRHGLLPGEDGA